MLFQALALKAKGLGPRESGRKSGVELCAVGAAGDRATDAGLVDLEIVVSRTDRPPCSDFEVDASDDLTLS